MVSAKLTDATAQAFLLKAGEELASSLDYETTLQRVARQAVPLLADACIVHLVGTNEELRPVAAASADAAGKSDLVDMLRERLQSPATALRAVRTGQPVFLPEFSEAVLQKVTEEEHAVLEPEYAWTVKALRMHSLVSMPLAARDRILGVLSLVIFGQRPRFVREDLPLIQHLAQQCALAVDNARLYREAQEAVRVRDEFLAATSHELRRPLSEIKGFATTLLRTDVNWDAPTRNDFLHEIDHEADRLDALINDLLDMSWLSSGADQNFRRTRTSPAVLASRSVDRVRNHARCLLDIDPQLGGLPPVWVDPRHIQQVLANVLENAMKYAPGSPIHVSGHVTNGGQAVELWVEDDGPGIAADDLPHVFDKFFRGRSARRSDVPGTGLGLAIAHAIVEGHGGTIRAQNRPEGGARFIVGLPVASRRSERRHQ